MKIAMFGHRTVPSRKGGVEVVTEQLCLRLAAQGHTVTCYNRAFRQKQKCHRGVRLRAAPALGGKGLAAASSSFFAAAAVSFSDADVCHIHGEGPALMGFLPRLLGKRVIVTVHGLDWAREKWGRLGAAYIRWGEKMAVRMAHEIIVLNRDTEDYFLRRYGRKTRFIPNAVEPPMPLPPERIRKFGLEKGSYFLFLGRLVPEKGVHDLIEAFRDVKTDKRLVIAGAGSDTADYVRRLKAMAREDRRVCFTGFVEGPLLRELYSNAFAFVLPSRLEGMPLSLLEAMSYGNCCVVSDIPACAEVVDDCALTFPVGDREKLRQLLQSLCGREAQAAELGKRASRLVRCKYSWEQTLKKTQELYHEDIAGS